MSTVETLSSGFRVGWARRPQWHTAAASVLAVALAVVLTSIVTAPPAQADPLPMGTFTIQNNNLLCAADTGVNPPYVVFMKTCSPTTLRQQWTYSPVTKQVVSVGRPGYCLSAIEFSPIYTTPDSVNYDAQRWDRWGPDGYGRYYITVNNLGTQCLAGDAAALSSISCQQGFPPEDRLLWRFPLI